MANLVKYNIDTAFTEDTTFETALNSLVSTSSGVGSVISNGTNLATLADLSFGLGSYTPAAPFYLEIHLIPLTGDGSNYSDLFQGGPTLIATATVNSGASIKYFTIANIALPPGSFKFGIVNFTGATLASSGHKVYYRLYNYTVNG